MSLQDTLLSAHVFVNKFHIAVLPYQMLQQIRCWILHSCNRFAGPIKFEMDDNIICIFDWDNLKIMMILPADERMPISLILHPGVGHASRVTMHAYTRQILQNSS